MDDKDKVQPTGGQDLPDDPGYSYEDIKKDSVRDIASNTEEPKETPKGEEKPAETPTVPEEPEVPLEDVLKKNAEETANAILAKQKADQDAAEAARIAEEKANKTPEQEYREIAADFEKKEGRAPTWEELAVKMEERALNKFQALQAEAKADADEQQRVQQEAQQKQVKETEDNEKLLNTVIDDELGDLYNAGKLTRIQDANNPSDPGLVERQALFTKWAQVNTERRAKGLPDITSATRIYEFYYQKPQGQSGANAPISGNRTSATPPGAEQEYSYADIKKPWSWWKRK